MHLSHVSCDAFDQICFFLGHACTSRSRVSCDLSGGTVEVLTMLALPIRARVATCNFRDTETLWFILALPIRARVVTSPLLISLASIELALPTHTRVVTFADHVFDKYGWLALLSCVSSVWKLLSLF